MFVIGTAPLAHRYDREDIDSLYQRRAKEAASLGGLEGSRHSPVRVRYWLGCTIAVLRAIREKS